MKPVFIDPSVLLLAVGAEHPLREPCRSVLDGAVKQQLRLHMSVEGGQEFLFHRLRRVELASALREFDAVSRLIAWHDFNVEVLTAARDLVATGTIRGRDAVHAATALLAGFDAIISCDADFDGISQLRRLDPTRDPLN